MEWTIMLKICSQMFGSGGAVPNNRSVGNSGAAAQWCHVGGATRPLEERTPA